MKTQSLEEQSTKDYLEKVKNTHRDPYWMSYEVVQFKRQTVFTSDFYYEAFDVFKEYLEEHKQAIHNKLAGRKQSDEARKKSRDAIREMSRKYFEYKSNGGTLSWNEYKHFLKEQRKNVKPE